MKHISAFVFALLAVPMMAQQVKVEFFTPQIVRVVKAAPGQEAEAASMRQSLVISSMPDKVKVSTQESAEGTTYRSESLVVTIKDDKVTFCDTKGQMLLTEGSYAFVPITEGVDKGAYRVSQSFALEADEPIYGLGLLQNGKMSQRGENRLMIQSNLEDYSHFFQSIKGYGIYWDNYSPTQISDGETLTLESQVGGLIDYYFMYGENADGVISQMRGLTGQVPMLPLWTYGFHQSRERYKSADELLEVVNRYRDLKVPFDGIIQDWQYWGSNYNWNSMDFINPDFEHAQEMIDEVHRQNAHMSISIWASFGPETKQYRELDKAGHLFSFATWPPSGSGIWPPKMDYPSGVRCYDVYSDEARDIYWKYLKHLYDMGIDAWWMDSTDPDHSDIKDSDYDELCAMGSWRSVRNLFPFMTVGGVFDHQRTTDPSKRVFILTRSYFAGQQRYGANTWSGDVGSSWENLRKQVPICLNYTLTANPNVNSDIGGFFANAYNFRSNDDTATKNPQFQELYVRWMQFGLFTPMMRSHGTEVKRELYYYGKEGEPVYDALVNAVKMRYRLLPYIYSQSWQVTSKDDSFMRALMMDFKDDRNTWDNNREYLFGHNLLVCPVVYPLFTEEKIQRLDRKAEWLPRKQEVEWPSVDWSQKKQYEVYLPAGANWYDYWTNTLLDGGQKVMADAPLAHSPLYVKAGTILPMAADAQYADVRNWQELELTVYPGQNAVFTLYEDEGDNYNYEQGFYSTIRMRWYERGRVLILDDRQGGFEGMHTTRTFKVHLAGSDEVQEVTYEGKKIVVHF